MVSSAAAIESPAPSYVEERGRDGKLRISVTTRRDRSLTRAAIIWLVTVVAAALLLLMTPVGSGRWIWAIAAGCLGGMIGAANLLIAMRQTASATHSFEVGESELVVRTFRAGDPITERHSLKDVLDVCLRDDCVAIVTSKWTHRYLYGENGNQLRNIVERLRNALFSNTGA